MTATQESRAHAAQEQSKSFRRSTIGRFLRPALSLAIAVLVPLVAVGHLGGLKEGWLLGLSLSELNFALITLLAALALHVLIGRTGLISIGSAGFYALGAGVGGLIGVQLEMPFEVVLIVSGVVGALIGAIVGLPSLKLKGLYALLATLAFHFIAIYAFLEYESAQFDTTGIMYPEASFLGMRLANDEAWYFFLIVIALMTFLGARNLAKDRQGRALLAVRDQELAAKLSGVSVGATKVKVYALTSSVTTVAGTLYVYYQSTATVELFTFDLAIHLIAIIVIGGLTSASGAIVGVAIWTMLPKLIENIFDQAGAGSSGVALSWITDNLDGLTNAVFGLAIVMIMVLRPAGLIGLGRILADSIPDLRSKTLRGGVHNGE
ncbi:branched-chain amino acid ABC transporter permease [Rhodococcus sp. WS4]|nr:branched-chain amino acid ABC transporter permease [Rhodococcus sp. WS4]